MPSKLLRESWWANCSACALPSSVRLGPGISVLTTFSALACDSACRMKVRVMLRTCGDPEQAPIIIITTSAAKAFQMTVRLRMAIACLVDGFDVVGLHRFAMVGRMNLIERHLRKLRVKPRGGEEGETPGVRCRSGRFAGSDGAGRGIC